MSKVYGVFYTKTGNVIFGVGGESGNPPEKRSGLHLPGGGISRKKDQHESNASVLSKLKVELVEELGSHGGQLLECVENNPEIQHYKLHGHAVYFVFVEISLLFPPGLSQAVDWAACGSINKFDTPFEQLEFLHVSDVLTKFGDEDWPKTALEHLVRQHFNGAVPER